MECSLTVLLPVEDVQAELAANVGRLLEVLSELTDRLEIIIVDDGSTDATIEVADELASRYPQVRAIRNSASHGRTRAIQRGLYSARGDVILLIDDDCCLPVDEVGLLWRGPRTRNRARPASAADCPRFDLFPAIRRRRAGRVPNAQPPRLPPLGLCRPPRRRFARNSPAPAAVARDRGRPAIVLQPHSRAELPPRSPKLPARSVTLRSASNATGPIPWQGGYMRDAKRPVAFLSFPSSAWEPDSSAEPAEPSRDPDLVHSSAFGYYLAGKVIGRRSAHSHLMAGWPFISRFGRNPKRNRSRIATSQHLGLFRQKAL